jgi:Ca2+-binding RTX toxin-like protein
MDDYGETGNDAGSIQVNKGPIRGSIDYVEDYDVFAIELIAGNRYQLDLIGDTLEDPYLDLLDDGLNYLTSNDDKNNNTLDSQIIYQASYTGTHYLATSEANDEDTGSYTVEANIMDDYGETENNAGSIQVNKGPVRGSIDYVEDYDVFAIELIAGNWYQLDLIGDTLEDPYLDLLDEDFNYITRNDDKSDDNLNSQIVYQASYTGTHYLATSEVNDEDTGSYTLEVILLDNYQQNDLNVAGDSNGIPKDDSLNGRAGNDKIYGLLGDDTLDGADGSDLLFGGYGDDVLFGGDGNDELYGEEENDTLNGGSGNDRLTGGEGFDLLIGGPGDDTYIIDDERDTIDDEGLDSDIDTVIFRANLTTYTVPDSIKNARLDSGSAFKLIGNAKANTLIGNDIDNDIDGGDGDDSLDGGGGDDTLKGGDGRDAVIYGKRISGFLLDGSGAKDITVNLLNGTASGSEIGNDSLIAIEDVLTGDGNDNLTGDNQDNRLDAGGGDDTISSGAGNDSIYGGNGDDRIDGGDGSDTAHFTGNFTYYEVTPTSNGFTITDTRAFHDGTDDVTGIEIFRFSDQSLAASQLLGSDTTNGDTGGFGFTSGEIISTGSAATQDVLIGDVNNSGTHDVSDAISVLRNIVGLEENLAEFPGVEPITLMDVDRNGQIGVSDAITILRTIVGLEQLDALVQI